MESLLRAAIETAQKAEYAYTKLITPNDVGATGAHQYGFHIHKSGWPMFFDRPGKRGEHLSEHISITWQQELTTGSRAIYYGEKSRNEYRLTRFGKGLPYLTEDHIGDLLVLCRLPKSDYQAFVLQSDEDIEESFAALNISLANANGLVEPQEAARPEDAHGYLSLTTR